MGRLDRILFRPSLTVSRVTTLTHQSEGKFPSDHYPVLAEFVEVGDD
jgi:endonuclease/exonuclease/phosphatase family metal-dependent hydrolase